MKPMTEQHLALFRRHMVEIVEMHFDLAEDESGHTAPSEQLRRALMDVPRHLFVPEPLMLMSYQDTPLPIEVATGAAITGIVVTVELRDGVIRGVATFGGKPARDAWVTARLHGPDGNLFPGEIGDSEPVLTDANGNFVIDHLRPRAYTLVAEGPRAASRGEKPGVKPGDTTTIELQSLGALTGHVKLRGRPVLRVTTVRS